MDVHYYTTIEQLIVCVQVGIITATWILLSRF